MRAPAVGSDVVYAANDERPRRIWADFWKSAKIIGIPYVFCLRALWPGIRFTQKDTVSRNPSKTLENEAKSANPQGWEGYG